MLTPRYRPPRTGVHVVAFDDDEERGAENHGPHVTLLSHDAPETRARELFAGIRSGLEAEEEADLLVELFVGDDIIDNFWIWRQSLRSARERIFGVEAVDS